MILVKTGTQTLKKPARFARWNVDFPRISNGLDVNGCPEPRKPEYPFPIKVFVHQSDLAGLKIKDFIRKKDFRSKSFYFNQESFIPFKSLFSHSNSFSVHIWPDSNKRNCTDLGIQHLFSGSNLFQSNQVRRGQL